MDKLVISHNLILNAPTQYDQWPFNSMCEVDGNILAFGEDGISICSVCGNDDNGEAIVASFRLPAVNLGVINQKRIRKFTLGFQAATDGAYILTVTDDNENARQYYLRPILPGLKPHSAEIYADRDGVGVYFAVQFDNVDGADFTIDTIEAIFEILGKKARRY